MKDSEIRGKILQRVYDLRHTKDFVQLPDDFSDLGIDPKILGNVASQLDQQGYIKFTKMMGRGYPSGYLQIQGYGVEVVEGTTSPAISISLDHSVSVHGSTNVQVGKGNIQNTGNIEQINQAIEQSAASQNEKQEAKSLLKNLSENKLLLAVLAKFGWDLS